jgi:hypothetical protein
MQIITDRPQAPTAIRTDLGAIFVSLELTFAWMPRRCFDSAPSTWPWFEVSASFISFHTLKVRP